MLRRINLTVVTSVILVACGSSSYENMGTGMPEVCDGKDNDGNGYIDDLKECWMPIHEYIDYDSQVYCAVPNFILPKTCPPQAVISNALIEVPVAQWIDGSNRQRVQCSQGNDHRIIIAGSSEYVNLKNQGWDCNVSLGYWFDNGKGMDAYALPGFLPQSATLPVYELTYQNKSGGTSHWYSSGGTVTLTNLTCNKTSIGEGHYYRGIGGIPDLCK